MGFKVMVDVNLAEKMRREGATYQEIANRFGVTKQAVHLAMQKRGRLRRRYEAIFESCPYNGLKRYLKDNERVKISNMCIAIFGNGGENAMAKTRRLIEGYNVLLTINNIKRLEKFTGMSFDALFCEDFDWRKESE